MPSALDGPTGGYRNSPVVAQTIDSPPPVPSAWNPSSEVLVVDYQAFLRAVATFQSAADSMRQAAGSAPQTGEGHATGAAPWGDDSFGAAFGNQYAPPAQLMNDALAGLSALFEGVSRSLASMQQSFADTQAPGLERLGVRHPHGKRR
ncbi:hypothetical protein [Streptomyces cadmiisoli]|uniref:hypothetical protein n=1 Tax=Streptomyces cadmiisoli TaxID=2184053 RepID=UPI0013A6DCC9|nr:hypothetical protein [Streptomyces cadmiisoli]